MFLRVFIAGYVACVLTIAAVGFLASCFAQTYVTATLGSLHLDRSHQYNEKNLGLGIEHVVQGDLRAHAGFYRNSFYTNTTYLMASYTPLTVWGAKLGPVGGVGTGYSKSGPVPLFGLAVLIEDKRGGVNIIINPAAIAMQVKLGFP